MDFSLKLHFQLVYLKTQVRRLITFLSKILIILHFIEWYNFFRKYLFLTPLTNLTKVWYFFCALASKADWNCS